MNGTKKKTKQLRPKQLITAAVCPYGGDAKKDTPGRHS